MIILRITYKNMHILCAYTVSVHMRACSLYVYVMCFATQLHTAAEAFLHATTMWPGGQTQDDVLHPILQTRERGRLRDGRAKERGIHLNAQDHYRWDIYIRHILHYIVAAIADAPASLRRKQCQSREGVETLTAVYFLLQIGRRKKIRQSLLYRIMAHSILAITRTIHYCPQPGRTYGLSS